METPSTNHLIHEQSPYLLQHAHNPVDWYPWGKEALEKAHRENKPIFLSIGYSTCHWCHVMERESFNNPDIAKLLNEHFISIKVDREERPDLDRIYMGFLLATQGSGGWPLSVWLTPEGKPFFGGTYYPPQQFKHLLQQISSLWDKDPQRIEEAATDISRRLSFTSTPPKSEDSISPAVLNTAFTHLKKSFDPTWGGFGGAPKFPQPPTLNLLLRIHRFLKQPEALHMVEVTLSHMARGAIHDQLGGGFHRYSTDERWHQPHFEKMLYDQAQLASLYLDTYRLTKKKIYLDTAEDIFNYVSNRLTSAQGGFYTAEDADSPISPDAPEDKEEGAFYTWTWDELSHILSPQEINLLSYHFGVSKRGNATGELRGKNLLYIAHELSETAQHYKLSPSEAEAIVNRGIKKLKQARSHRLPPHLDDKIMAGLNGLMITAYAQGYQVTRREEYLEQAEKAARFILQNLVDAKGKLLRYYRQKPCRQEAFNFDYAALITALTELYESTFDPVWLQRAADLQDLEIDLFWDPKEGAFFETTGQDPSVMFRAKEYYDGAVPASNSLAAHNLIRLGYLLDRRDYIQKGEQIFNRFATVVMRSPSSMPALLCAYADNLHGGLQIVLAGTISPDTLDLLRSSYIPEAAILKADRRLSHTTVYSNNTGYDQSIYLCQNFSCKAPVHTASELKNLLDQIP